MDPKKVLKDSALFCDLNSLELLKVLEVSRRRFVPKGETIISEGENFETDASFYIIASGLVKVAVPMGEGKELVLGILPPHEQFGEMSFVDHRPRSASVIAMEDTELLKIDHDALDRIVAEDRDLGLRFYRSLTRALVGKVRTINNRLLHDHRRIRP